MIDGSCMCPIHTQFTRIWERPMGVPLSKHVSIRNIQHDTAGKIYKNHHSYIPEARTSGTPIHHGIYVKDHLSGAISYSYELVSEDIRGYSSDEFMGVSRVCVVPDIPNLASCAMSKSQDKFVGGYARSEGIKMLVTYVIDSKEGTMFKALRGKGWRRDRFSEPGQAGNRKERKIRDQGKWRWVCELDVEPETKTQSILKSL